MALPYPSMPSGWRALVGTYGTDINTYQAGTTQFMANDKYVRLEDTSGGSGLAPSIESSRIPYRSFRTTEKCVYDFSVAYQASRANAGDNITMSLTLYNQSGAVISTSYLDDEAGTALNATNAAGTGYSYASKTVVATAAASLAYVKVTITKANTAFTLDIHGVHVRAQVAYHRLEQDGAAVTVADSFGAPAWTPLNIAPASNKVRMYDYQSTTGRSASAVHSGIFQVYAVAKCEDVPLGSEFAIRILEVDVSTALSNTYEGQRIVGGGNSMTWQISASAIVSLGVGDYIKVECQHIGNGAAGNLSVELVTGYVVDCLPWQ